MVGLFLLGKPLKKVFFMINYIYNVVNPKTFTNLKLRFWRLQTPPTSGESPVRSQPRGIVEIGVTHHQALRAMNHRLEWADESLPNSAGPCHFSGVGRLVSTQNLFFPRSTLW